MNNTIMQTRKIKEGFIGQKMTVLPPDIKRHVTKNELTKRFHFTSIGFYPHAAYHDRERKTGCSQYILLYCVEGSGTINIPGKTVPLTPNTYCIIPKNVPHHYKSSVKDPWTIYWIHFIGDHADQLFGRYLEIKRDPVAIPYDEKRIAAFEEIFNMLENSFEDRSMEIVNIKLLEFVSSLIYFMEIDPSLHDDDVISDSINFMKNNLKARCTAEELAGRQHLSVSHYSRLFRSKTGSSPLQYFNNLKIQKSCQFLYFTDRNIKEICTELGFEDPYYFSRLFKKLMGMSPANYKTQHKKNERFT